MLGLRRPGAQRRPSPRPRPRRPRRAKTSTTPLTGLPNRGLTLDRAERMLARAGRNSSIMVGALFVDIDWFKDVNEKLGQEAGDQLLKIVAERLAGRGPHPRHRRSLGGDEFVIIVESPVRGVRLDSLARRIIEALHKPVEHRGLRPELLPDGEHRRRLRPLRHPDDLLRDAQMALFAAKAAGKDRYTLFNANMRSVIEGRGVLEVELNTALQEDQFSLLYQPIYDLVLAARRRRSRRCCAGSTRPRARCSPADFIPLAEESGLIVPIGRWALEEACTRAAAWNVAGHRVGVAVKVSAKQLNRDGFATDVLRALQQSGLEPSLLTLEIAESDRDGGQRDGRARAWRRSSARRARSRSTTSAAATPTAPTCSRCRSTS